MSDLRSKFELICGQCPLDQCDENSLWCAYRFATKPNAAQQRALEIASRREYYRSYYKANRKRKIQAALDRYHAKRQEQTA